MISNVSSRFTTLLSFLILFNFASAQDSEIREDSLFYNLSEIEVSTNTKPKVPTLKNGDVIWSFDEIDKLPQIFGYADPIKYSQTLPGIQTNNEYDAGIHIYGCDNSHNYVGIEGVNLYNANHILGFFSNFNTSHFQDCTISKTATNSKAPNRLGGYISMGIPKNIPDSICGDFSIGLISSQGSINIPTSKKSFISISARASYINLLYKSFLTIDDNALKYTFGDANFSWVYKPDSQNTIYITSYCGQDNANIFNINYLADISLKWSNKMASLNWERKIDQNIEMKQSLYFTGYNSKFNIDQTSLSFKLPSSINDIGYFGNFNISDFNFGANAICHFISPQNPQIKNSYNSTNNAVAQSFITQEYSIFSDWNHQFSPKINWNIGLRGNLYVDNNFNSHLSASPTTTLRYANNKIIISLTSSLKHQYIYQTGVSTIGLPTEFWTSCNNYIKPQRGFNLNTFFQYKIGNGYRISTEAYYKHLTNVTEYIGNLFDFINTDYELNQHIYQGDGNNYGINFMFQKTTAPLTGWISYNFGRALRNYDTPKLKGTFSANHERIHELNAVISYQINKHWDLGATYVFASGTPYTAPQFIYLYAGKLISKYEEHNSSRLKPYSRLDLSVNYCFKVKFADECGINLSIYNTLATKNELFCTWGLGKNNTLVYKPISFFTRILPTLNFYVKI